MPTRKLTIRIPLRGTGTGKKVREQVRTTNINL